ARKATRTGLGDASVQRPNTEAEKLQEQIYGMTQWVSGKANKIGITLAAVLFLGIQNAGAVPPVIDEDSIHLIMTFSWFQDGQISYEEFEAI
ncbi:hypothetical protein Tco_1139431, partial [Tanacetum coccineum]